MSKSLPSSTDAECSVLGCLLLDNGCYAEVASSLSPSDFFDVNNKAVFEAIKDLMEKEMPVDAIILSEHLANNVAIRALGGFSYFINLARMTPSTKNISTYIDIVKQKSLLRQLLTITSNIHNQVYTPNINPRGLMMELEKFISENAVKRADTPFLQDATELLKQRSSQEWLIKHWLPKDSLAMLHAKSGVGKSFVALDWALHIATKKPAWLGNTTTAGSVVYLAGEGNIGLRRRVKAWLQENDFSDDELPLYISSRGCKLDTVEGYNEIVKAINDLKIEPCLIIVDTLHRFLTGHMNDSQDAGKMISHCDRLREGFNSTVLLVHHVGHSDSAQERAMGSTAWKAHLDVEMHLAKKEGVLELSQKKMKEDEEEKPIILELQQVTIHDWIDADGEPVTSAIIKQSSHVFKDEKDTPAIANAKILFEASWRWNGKRLTKESCPYVLREHMIEYLVKVKNYSESSARQILKAGAKDKFVGLLVEAGALKIYSEGGYSGWYICSETWLNTAV